GVSARKPGAQLRRGPRRPWPDPVAHRRDREVRARHLLLQWRPRGTVPGRGPDPGAQPQGRHLRPAAGNELPGSHRTPGRGEPRATLRRDHLQPRQPGHGRPHRRPEGRDPGGRGGGPSDRRGGRRGARRPWRAGHHRRPRQPGNDARPRDRTTAHRAHGRPGAAAVPGRARSQPAQRGRPARRRPDPARPDGPAQAGRDDRAQPAGRTGERQRLMPHLRAAAGVAAVLLVLACAFGAPAQDSRETERKLDRAQRELKAISAERRKLEGQRGSASRELRALDEKLAAASRALHDTEARIARQQEELAELQARRKTLDASLATQKAQLAALLRSAYTIGDDAPLKLLLSQDSVAEANRLLALHRYLQADRARRVDSLTRELRELAEVEQRIAERQRELDATRARQRTQLAALQDERKAHARAVAQLEA